MRACVKTRARFAFPNGKAMTQSDWPFIRIAAGLIIDGAGRVLVVRKRGTQTFMQAGGKIEPHESPYDALVRELQEEIGLRLEREPEYLGQFVAEAANEMNRKVQAEVFYIQADPAVLRVGRDRRNRLDRTER